MLGFKEKFKAAWEALEIGAKVAWGGPKSTRVGVVIWKQPDEPMGYPMPYPSLVPSIHADAESLGADTYQIAAWSIARENPSALVRDDKRSRRGEPVYRLVKVSRLREAV